MKLKYIKAGNKYYYPTEKEGNWKPVCFIKQLSGGRFQIDMWDELSVNEEKVESYHTNTPNTKIILYPSGIQEIRYE